MPAFDAQLIFSVLGPLFLVLGVWRWAQASALVPQGRAWLIIGVIFSAVAVWLAFVRVPA